MVGLSSWNLATRSLTVGPPKDSVFMCQFCVSVFPWDSPPLHPTRFPTPSPARAAIPALRQRNSLRVIPPFRLIQTPPTATPTSAPTAPAPLQGTEASPLKDHCPCRSLKTQRCRRLKTQHV